MRHASSASSTPDTAAQSPVQRETAASSAHVPALRIRGTWCPHLQSTNVDVTHVLQVFLQCVSWVFSTTIRSRIHSPSRGCLRTLPLWDSVESVSLKTAMTHTARVFLDLLHAEHAFCAFFALRALCAPCVPRALLIRISNFTTSTKTWHSKGPWKRFKIFCSTARDTDRGTVASHIG